MNLLGSIKNHAILINAAVDIAVAIQYASAGNYKAALSFGFMAASNAVWAFIEMR